jgi:hypothetical protein
MEDKIQPTMYFVLQQNALLYTLMGEIKKHTRVCRTSCPIAKYGVAGKSLKRKKRYSLPINLFLM